ncbi:uncharacterized protein LOC130628594 [Hydractinia symbiolongicarpus]|uniref:uncharacterized protein LOC130628594 n=1 Tax=Hydractinia symbiolongicarpus TaxID=13093 RepID=UPI00254A34D5|nr:uncharacterized protein LOC130628594 [Hydractinia symbiolongicarpus]
MAGLLTYAKISLSFSSRAVINTSLRTFASTTKKTTAKKSGGAKKSKKSTDEAQNIAPEGITIPQDPASYEEYSKSYKCPEYYEHNDLSYYDMENSMSSHRLPQPSAL